MEMLEILGLLIIIIAFLIMFLVIWGLMTGRSEILYLIDFLNELISRIYPIMKQ